MTRLALPSERAQVITEFPEVATQYQIVLTTRGPLDHVELQVETEPDFPIDEGRGRQREPGYRRRCARCRSRPCRR